MGEVKQTPEFDKPSRAEYKEYFVSDLVRTVFEICALPIRCALQKTIPESRAFKPSRTLQAKSADLMRYCKKLGPHPFDEFEDVLLYAHNERYQAFREK